MLDLWRLKTLVCNFSTLELKELLYFKIILKNILHSTHYYIRQKLMFSVFSRKVIVQVPLFFSKIIAQNTLIHDAGKDLPLGLVINTCFGVAGIGKQNNMGSKCFLSETFFACKGTRDQRTLFSSPKRLFYLFYLFRHFLFVFFD